MATLAQIYDWFMTGKKPTQAQFWASWGSFWNKSETIPQSAISNLTNTLNAKTENDQFNAHKVAEDAHADLFLGKEDKNKKGAANGYAPLNEFQKLAIEYLNVVNDLVTGGATSLLSAEQGKLLQTQITGINLLLTSYNINLDSVQEIVDAIETVQTSLSTILVNDLTTGGNTKALTAEMGKSLKGLIDALSTTVGNITSNVVTTFKPILSTALTAQNTAGIVAYINALNPVLAVAANEIVKFNTTDTGRVFELRLRGRSFGVGQAAIVAADVLDVTDFLNKDVRLSNYPNTRNDGQIPTNKVLSTDALGNLKLYSIATAPAPYIQELIPDSYLPSTTGNIRILGSFFTPAMCDRVANPTAIVIGGVNTINYATFKSSNEILVNVITGAIEGSFFITMNNGLSTTKNNALLITYGVVYKPNATSWVDLDPSYDMSEEGAAKIGVYGTYKSATWNKSFDFTKNWRLKFMLQKTPLGDPMGTAAEGNTNERNFALVKESTKEEVFYFGMYKNSGSFKSYGGWLGNGNVSFYAHRPASYWDVPKPQDIHEFRYQYGSLYYYVNGIISVSSTLVVTENLLFKLKLKVYDVSDIEYIEIN
ncbi:hypothetical protein [Flavobacterium degerlachei]|uniref:Uncharacterized protein n=1 Tax=Flavobacterium degerlachei TaxID=229203 RepID=A0A1H2Z4L3_9FLAO|nr:hypothetical protein [Flavobacterium degerlachei]SDX12413.1 hypothetical protein SAMN05444338_10782 [Flavobacterium degerlachei]